MAIIIRKIKGLFVALNARKTIEQDGDIYLSDAAHRALSTKFGVDFHSMGFMEKDFSDEEIKRIMLDEEWKCTCKLGEIDPECPIHKSQ